jgi:hypothetical protein
MLSRAAGRLLTGPRPTQKCRRLTPGTCLDGRDALRRMLPQQMIDFERLRRHTEAYEGVQQPRGGARRCAGRRAGLCGPSSGIGGRVCNRTRGTSGRADWMDQRRVPLSPSAQTRYSSTSKPYAPDTGQGEST